jgi:hypothetical protein
MRITARFPAPIRRMGTTGAIATVAIALLAGGGGVALASSSASAPPTITACYKAGSAPTALDRVNNGAACPKGDTKLVWNLQGPRGATGAAGPKGATGAAGKAGAQGTAGAKGATGATGATGAQGPAGPAGNPAGASGASGTIVNLGDAKLHTVLTTSPVSVPGTYLVTASVDAVVDTGDYVACTAIDGNSNAEVGVGPSPAPQYQDISVVDTVTATAGQQLAVECQDYESNTGTYYFLGTIDATLIAPASASAATSHAARVTLRAPARLAG